jgi:iron-sulfur cluster assembly protein
MNIVTFSPTALSQIKKTASDGGHDGLALRIAAKMTADETIDYGLGFDEIKEGDTQFEHDDITVIIDKSSAELLHGAHVDFVEIESGQHHFIFMNPNDPSYKPPTENDAV